VEVEVEPRGTAAPMLGAPSSPACGGVAGKEVGEAEQALCAKIQPSVEAYLRETYTCTDPNISESPFKWKKGRYYNPEQSYSGWTCTEVMTQVVAGTIYYFKIALQTEKPSFGEGDAVVVNETHPLWVKVFEQPWTNTLQVLGVLFKEKDMDSPIEPFDNNIDEPIDAGQSAPDVSRYVIFGDQVVNDPQRMLMLACSLADRSKLKHLADVDGLDVLVFDEELLADQPNVQPTPLLAATEAVMADKSEDCHEAVSFLLDRKADINAANAKGWTALHWAASKGDLPVVQALVEAGAEQNEDKDGNTPLLLAFEFRRREVAMFLEAPAPEEGAAEE